MCWEQLGMWGEVYKVVIKSTRWISHSFKVQPAPWSFCCQKKTEEEIVCMLAEFLEKRQDVHLKNQGL